MIEGTHMAGAHRTGHQAKDLTMRCTNVMMAELVEMLAAEYLSTAEYAIMKRTAKIIAQRTGHTLDAVLTAAA